MRLMHELCKCPHWCQNSTRLHSSVISLEIICREAEISSIIIAEIQ